MRASEQERFGNRVQHTIKLALFTQSIHATDRLDSLTPVKTVKTLPILIRINPRRHSDEQQIYTLQGSDFFARQVWIFGSSSYSLFSPAQLDCS